ncbi:HNH endonuclease signature motif containing protein [Glutamicibacter ectropisis]|uniref:HNH endonuclease signature motif containing protein n=1 Tax=Glutamicibacter ectropisis TaxID=3046593 RepID=A0AAU6WH53_9MICC
MWRTHHTPDEFCPREYSRDQFAYSVWEKCLDTVRDNDDPNSNWSVRKSALTASLNLVSSAHEKFYTSARTDALWELDEAKFQNGEKSKEYSGWLYTEKLKGYKVVDKLRERILSTSMDDLCPYCNHRTVYDLDHFLPKEKFHLIAVNPWNLVPSCKECNSLKSSFSPKFSEEQFYHPYFSSTENLNWLKAKVIESDKPVINFYVSDDFAEYGRVKRIFEKLQLNRLYKAQTARELLVFSKSFARLKHMPERILRHRVRENLIARGAERSLLPNDWKRAMFIAMAESDWYCDIGFKSSW